jgi:hypothetical protein
MYKGVQMKSLCYCCDNSVDGKPRTILEPVTLESFEELTEQVFMLNEKVSSITNSNVVLKDNYKDYVSIRKNVLSRGTTVL